MAEWLGATPVPGFQKPVFGPPLYLINVIPLFPSLHLSFLADLFGVSVTTGRHIRRSAGWMMFALMLFRILVIAFRPGFVKVFPQHQFKLD